VDSSDLAQAKAEIFKALGHPARLLMVETLAEGPRSAGDLAKLVTGTQATASRHLDVLLKAGVVSRSKQGVRMLYELALPCLLRAMPCVTEALLRRAAHRAKLLT
jgi:DNA-binding transcriptional ArsR family regulator